MVIQLINVNSLSKWIITRDPNNNFAPHFEMHYNTQCKFKYMVKTRNFKGDKRDTAGIIKFVICVFW